MLAGCDVATTDAGENACDTTLEQGAPDGSFNSCGQCIDATYLPLSGNGPALWGLNEVVELEPSAGDTADAYAVIVSLNLGGCVIASDPTHGQACGLDLMAIDACGWQTCAPLCPVPAAGSMSAENALFNCFNAAATGACAEYTAAAQSDCAPLSNHQGTGVYDKCVALVNEDQFLTDGGPTESSEQQLITLMCGN
jgi:hypothetical protein